MVPALLTTLLLASFLVVVANPTIVARKKPPKTQPLPSTNRFNPSPESLTTGANVEARNFIMDSSSKKELPLIKIGISYAIAVWIGPGYNGETPLGSPNVVTLKINIGSGSTWTGANGAHFTNLNSILPTNQSMVVDYQSGRDFTGLLYNDELTFTSDIYVQKQSFGIANENVVSNVSGGIDGILGLGPAEFTVGTLPSDPNTSVPTVLDNLFNQGRIADKVYAFSFKPDSAYTSWEGSMTLGQFDSSSYQINFFKVSPALPAAWSIEITSMSYGSTSDLTFLIKQPISGIIDTSTPFLHLASDVYETYRRVTGATLDESNQMLVDPTSLKSLFIVIKQTSFELNANAQVLPTQYNSFIDGSQDKTYLGVVRLPTNSSNGPAFVFGWVFLQRYYSVFDMPNYRVGLAPTNNTLAVISTDPR